MGEVFVLGVRFYRVLVWFFWVMFFFIVSGVSEVKGIGLVR